MNRRSFISRGVTGMVGASLLPNLLQAHAMAPMAGPIGFQSWVVRETIGTDFSGTLKKMRALGYNSLELCSPAGYTKYGFGPLEKMTPAQIKQVLTDEGFSSTSCHYGFAELKDSLPQRIEFAKGMGHEQMICSSFGLPKDAKLSDWKRSAGELNKAGEAVKKAGLQLGFHNHHMEFAKLEGELIYDVLLKEFDPNLIKLQFQVGVITLGYKAADYFKKYPGRFISAHLYDWPGHGEEYVALGSGVVDFKELFNAGNASGVKNYFVEMSEPLLKDSATYLKNLTL